jgi:hypothetical protein
MSNFVALTEIGRWSLGGSPFCPAFDADNELLIYRTNATEIRKAVYGVSDDSVTTLLTYTTGARIQGRMAEVGGNQYYFAAEGYLSPSPGTWYVNQIDINTGLIVTKSITPGVSLDNSYMGQVRIANDSLYVLCAGAPNGSIPTDRLYAESIPIVPSASYVDYDLSILAGPGAPSYEPVPQFSRQLLNQVPTSLAGGDFIRLVSRRTTGPDIRRIIGSYCYDDMRIISPAQDLFVIQSGPIASTNTALTEQVYPSYYMGGPWHWLEDDNYFYAFVFRYNNSLSSQRLWAYQRVSKTTWSSSELYTLPSGDFGFDNLAIPDNFGTRPRCYDAFAMDSSKTFAYWTVGNRATRYIHKSLKWPIDTYDSYEVDDTGGEVTGIWVKDPYVYVSKSGGTQGNQLIKFFDSELESIDLSSLAELEVLSSPILEESIEEESIPDIDIAVEYVKGDLEELVIQDMYDFVLQAILDNFTPEMVRQYQESILFKSFIEALARVMAEAKYEISQAVKQLNIQQAASLFLTLWANITGIARQNIDGVAETDAQYRSRLFDSVFWDKISNSTIKKSVLLRLGEGTAISDRAYAISERTVFTDPPDFLQPNPTAKYLSNLVEISLDSSNATDETMASVYDEVTSLLSAGNVVAYIARSLTTSFSDVNSVFGHIAYGPIFMQWYNDDEGNPVSLNVSDVIYLDNQYKMNDGRYFDNNSLPDDLIVIEVIS